VTSPDYSRLARRLPPVLVILFCAGVLITLVAAHFLGSGEAQPVAGNKAEVTAVVVKESDSIDRAVRAGAPREYAKHYVRAAEANGLPWPLLAGIGEAESDHGTSTLPGIQSGINSVGCCAGPMQICVDASCGNVAATYAVDGDRDKQFSIYSPADAIWTAANYLQWMTDLVGERPRILAAAYNAGPTIVSEVGIPDYPETQAYVDRVTRFMNRAGG
jgi:membrane-bound lytic murein transglycosylase B